MQQFKVSLTETTLINPDQSLMIDIDMDRMEDMPPEEINGSIIVRLRE